MVTITSVPLLFTSTCKAVTARPPPPAHSTCCRGLNHESRRPDCHLEGTGSGRHFQGVWPAYREASKLPLQHLKAMSAIEACRTPELGGFLEVCDNCGVARKVFRSCRNRNCPKCGWIAKEKWLLKRKEDLLPVPYFHVVLDHSGLT